MYFKSGVYNLSFKRRALFLPKVLLIVSTLLLIIIQIEIAII